MFRDFYPRRLVGYSELSMTQKRTLTLFDSTCLIVGIIIRTGIYKTAPDVARGVHYGWGIFLIWIGGGLLSLFGALE